MKRRKWMALMLCAGIFMADFSGIPLKVSAEQVEQAETVLDDQGTQKDDGENTELIQETEDENNSEESPIETEPEERAAEDTTTEELPSTEVVTELKTTIVSNKTAREYVDRTVELTTNVEDAVGNVEYQYTEEYRGETAVVQEYAENPVYSFKTSGVGEHVYRVNVKDENGKWVQVPYYIKEDKYPLGHGSKSVIFLQQFIKLTMEEIMAINWHMGFSVPKEDYGYLGDAFTKYPLAVALHEADLEATYLLEEA